MLLDTQPASSLDHSSESAPPLRTKTRGDVDDITPTLATPPSSQVIPNGFTVDLNPFLFPLTLLDRWAFLGDSTEQIGSSEAGNGRPAGREPAQAPSGKDESPRWWLVHTKPRQEKRLAEELYRRNVPHYLPATNCKAVTRGRTRITKSPQFPSYMFIWADADKRIRALETNRIVATHPVRDQPGLGSQLWTLADLIEKGVPLRVEERLAPGQTVRVKSGLLQDKRGTVIKRGGKTRLFVFVSELLGGVSLEIEQHLLEPY